MAEIFQAWRREDCAKDVERALHLTEEESKSDPETEPFKSKYAAREIWGNVENRLAHFLDTSEEDADAATRRDICQAIGAVKVFLGCNFIETEETSKGEEKLHEAWDLFKEDKLCIKNAGISLRILNQLGILWSDKNDHESSLQLLKEAEQLFKDYSASRAVAPFIVRDLIVAGDDASTSEDVRRQQFELEHTHTLFYLAQVFGNLEQREESADYCRQTLQRQLEMKQYNPKDWALNCATLSQYYLAIDNYPLARHCLASASKMVASVQSDDYFVKKASADVSRSWIKYCLDLLRESVKIFGMEGAGGRDESSNCSPNLFNLDVSEHEYGGVPTSLVNTFDAARSAFLAAVHHVKAAKEFYIFDSYASDHVSLVQDHSQLFKAMATFEPDLQCRCQMHKRRIGMLESLVTQLNPQFYLQICRQMTFELAEVYNTMLDLKMNIAGQKAEPPSQHAMQKVNHLTKKAIEHFQKFVDSYQDHKKEFPKTFESDSLRPVLTAKFCMARLWTKFVVSGKAQRVENIEKALSLYQEIVDYKKQHPDMPRVFDEEMGVCEEMICLLPLKLAKLTKMR